MPPNTRPGGGTARHIGPRLALRRQDTSAVLARSGRATDGSAVARSRGRHPLVAAGQTGSSPGAMLGDQPPASILLTPSVQNRTVANERPRGPRWRLSDGAYHCASSPGSVRTLLRISALVEPCARAFEAREAIAFVTGPAVRTLRAGMLTSGIGRTGFWGSARRRCGSRSPGGSSGRLARRRRRT